MPPSQNGKHNGGNSIKQQLKSNRTAIAAAAPFRAALCLHGKIGSIDRGQGWTRAVDNGPPTVDVAVISYAGFVRHLVEPNRATHKIDIFGHSWSPQLGSTLDALFMPVGSAHQPEERARNRALCDRIGDKLRQLTAALGNTPWSRFGVVGRGADSCDRTASHLLGMQRAIQLKAQAEKAGGFVYDVVMVSRWDVLWSRPFLFSRVDTSGNAFSLPTYCTHTHHIDHKSDLEKRLHDYRTAVCGGAHSHGFVPTAATMCHPIHRPCSGDLSSRARELYLLDWWFVSSSKAADGFALVAEPGLFANYTLLNQQKLVKSTNARPILMGHAYWGMHMVWGLRAPLRFVAALAVDFSLGRVYKRDTGATTCRALKPYCAGNTCSEADVLSRPWHTAFNAATGTPLRGTSGSYVPMPKRPAVEYKYGAEQTRYACGEGYFTCHGTSTMCQEEKLTWEPMDTTPMRAGWINCTAQLCTRLGIQHYSPRCAGTQLLAWTAVWRHSPSIVQSNTSLAIELRDNGATDGSAVGWYDPAQAAAALSTLTRQAHEMTSATTPGNGPPPTKIKEVLHECAKTVTSDYVRHEEMAEILRKAKKGKERPGRRLSQVSIDPLMRLYDAGDL